MRKFSISASLVFLIVTTQALEAQFSPGADMAQGLSPYAVYSAGNIDNVNPVNGNIFVQIPLLNYPQRGKDLKLTFNIYFNDKQWYISNLQGSPPQGEAPYFGTWSWDGGIPGSQTDNVGVYVARDQHLDFGQDLNTETTTGGGEPYEQYTVTTQLFGYFVRGSDGSKHYYADYQFQGCSVNGGSGTCPTTYNYANQYPASDGSGFVPSGPSLTGASKILGPDGVKYTLASHFVTVTDPQGNAVQAASTGWTDSLGRVVPGSLSGPGNSDNASPGLDGQDPIPGVPTSVGETTCPSGTVSARQWAVPSVNGGTETYYLCYASFPWQTSFDLDTALNTTYWSGVIEGSSSAHGSRPAILLSAIELPNHTAYQFSYDPYLSLTEITLPTGGTIAYTWQNVGFSPNGPGSTPMSRAIKTRTLTPGNGQPAETWNYHWYLTYKYSNDSLHTPQMLYPVWSVETDPAGNDVEHQLGANGYYSIGAENSRAYYSGCGPHDTATDKTCSSAPGSVLKTETYTLTPFQEGGADYGSLSSSPSNPAYRPTATTTTWASSGGTITTEVVKGETPGYGTCTVYAVGGSSDPQPQAGTVLTPCYYTYQPQSVSYYDFAAGASPGPLLKEITTNYKWQQSQPYLNANLLNLVGSTITYDGTNNRTGETDYGYDESNGSPQGTFGNQTSATTVLVGGTSPKTRIIFNTQGMPHQEIDARGYTTTYTYDGTGAFLSLVQYPPTGSVTHNESFVFDENTGGVTSHTDQNGYKTTYSHADPLNRVTAVTLPATTDGTTGNNGSGTTTYTYDDSPGALSLTEATLLTGNTYVTQLTNYDGLGRVIQTKLTSDTAGADIVNTTYDAVGRIQTVSNPFRLTADPTYGLTTYSYDALGRKVKQLQPDNSALLWCYDGTSGQGCLGDYVNNKSASWVDSIDENGKRWQRAYDGLGRMTAVIEDPRGFDYETDYSYDALDNLKRIDQWGGRYGSASRQIRTFSYDSLSRLISGYNSETGTVCYGTYTGGACVESYDGNGNLINKTTGSVNYPASQNKPATTVSYSYDPLNRLTQMTQSDGSPPEYFGYDAGGATVNAIGRMTSEEIAFLSSNTILAKRTYTNFDPMGRMLLETQCVYPCASTLASPSYTYDLAGNVTTASNGVNAQPISLTYRYDHAGRLDQILGNVDTAAQPKTIFLANSTIPASYTPAGALAYAQLGVGDGGQTALTETRSYQSRNREVMEQVKAGSAGIYSFDMTPGGLLPNGNVTGVKDDLVGQWTYTYDGINRLIAATGVAGSHYGGPGGPLLDGQSLGWSYDGFGNQYNESATAQPGYPNVFGQFAHGATPNGNNQYVSFQYDAAGNTLYDGVNHYAIDGLDRVCGAKSGANGNSYVNVYDASGHRVEKGTVNTYSNCGPFSSNGFSMTSEAVLGQSGEEFAEYTPSGGWATNVYANGELLATYQGSNLYFALNDWQGTKRVIANVNPATGLGRYVAGFYNLPFGDDFGPYTAEPSSHHFTGQLYDAETYLDYFGARHYTPVWGRFLSPDPSGLVYADPSNPQSLNLYVYGLNNPLVNFDPTGLSCVTLTTPSLIGSIASSGYGGSTTQADDGDGKGCAAAGILPSDQSATDPNGGKSQYSDTLNVNVKSPAPGTDLDFDTRVAVDQNFLNSRQTQSAPTSAMYLRAIAQQTKPVETALNCGGRAGLVGTASYFGVSSLSPNPFRDVANGAQAILATAGAEGVGAAVSQGLKAAGPTIAAGAGRFAENNVAKVVPFALAAQGVLALANAYDAYKKCASNP